MSSGREKTGECVSDRSLDLGSSVGVPPSKLRPTGVEGIVSARANLQEGRKYFSLLVNGGCSRGKDPANRIQVRIRRKNHFPSNPYLDQFGPAKS